MKRSDMDFVYNVVCPVCGTKPSYQATCIRPDGGIATYKDSTCGHSEVKNLIDQRHNEVFTRLQKKQ
jgi:hypothetical protein